MSLTYALLKTATVVVPAMVVAAGAAIGLCDCCSRWRSVVEFGNSSLGDE